MKSSHFFYHFLSFCIAFSLAEGEGNSALQKIRTDKFRTGKISHHFLKKSGKILCTFFLKKAPEKFRTYFFIWRRRRRRNFFWEKLAQKNFVRKNFAPFLKKVRKNFAPILGAEFVRAKFVPCKISPPRYFAHGDCSKDLRQKA